VIFVAILGYFYAAGLPESLAYFLESFGILGTYLNHGFKPNIYLSSSKPQNPSFLPFLVILLKIFDLMVLGCS
jgi:hypothetical protein